MKTPNFWRKKTIISFILLPLSGLYKFASIVRNSTITPTKINKPIICIGNLTIGGAGKTPIAIAIGNIIKDMGVQFSYLGHGYKANIDSLTLVNKKKHSNYDVGDEALLLSEVSNTFISGNRIFAAKQIAKMPDEKLIIMDDGFQNPSLKKDFCIIVIDGNYGLGNNLIFPAGPLRQTRREGSKNADLIIINGEDKFGYAKKFNKKKVILTKIKATNKAKFRNKKLIAFCGIARPEKFFDTLKDCKLDVSKEISFADHYAYKKKDLDKLIELSQKEDAQLVTTKKDFVRIDKEYQDKVKYLDIEIVFKASDRKYIENILMEIINEN